MPDDDQLLNLAGGDRALANVLRSSLRRLADGAGGEQLRWVARDALAGTFDIRQLATLSMLAPDVTAQFEGLRAWREEIGNAEFERLADRARDTMGTARAALDRTDADPPA